MCAVCFGRGEVEAGITGGRVVSNRYLDSEGKPDGDCYPTWCRPNPNAIHKKQGVIYFLDVNPLLKLWSTAICAECNGTGMQSLSEWKGK